MDLLDTTRFRSQPATFTVADAHLDRDRNRDFNRDCNRDRTTCAPSAPRARPAPRLNSETLFGAGQEIEIAHGSAVYRLRITSLGKLILTK